MYSEWRYNRDQDAPCIVIFDSHKRIKAAKEHVCNYCKKPIAKGSIYFRTSYRDDDDGGKFKVDKECYECNYRDMSAGY